MTSRETGPGKRSRPPGVSRVGSVVIVWTQSMFRPWSRLGATGRRAQKERRLIELFKGLSLSSKLFSRKILAVSKIICRAFHAYGVAAIHTFSPIGKVTLLLYLRTVAPSSSRANACSGFFRQARRRGCPSHEWPLCVSITLPTAS